MALDHLSSVDDGAYHAVAVESADSPDSEAKFKFVSFYVGDRHYAIPARSVAEVTGQLSPTPLPDSPRTLLGIAPHRGDILAVVDLGASSGTSDPAKKKAVVLRNAGENVELGIAFNVDRIGELLQVGGRELTASASDDALAEFETRAGGHPVFVIEPSRIADLASF